MTDRDFVLHYQAKLIFETYRDRRTDSPVWEMTLPCGVVDEDGNVMTLMAEVSDRPDYRPSPSDLTNILHVDHEFSDGYYHAILGQCYLPDGSVSDHYTDAIAYVRRRDQAYLCGILKGMFREAELPVNDIRFCPVTAGRILKRRMGYRHLCIFR